MASFATLPNGKIRAQLCVNGKRTGSCFDTREQAQRWAALKEAELGRENNSILSTIPPRVLRAMSDVEFTHNDIVAGATLYDSSSGVYFLIKNSEVVYVGKSVNVFSRIGAHRREGGAWFDSFNVIRCPIDQMEQLEEKYILALMPKMNTSITYRKRQATPDRYHQGTGRKRLAPDVHQKEHSPTQGVDL